MHELSNRPMQQIDFPARLSTGVLKVGKDWPGVFIRGDEALGFERDITRCIEGIKDGSLPADQRNGRLEELLRLLASCKVDQPHA